MAEAEAQAEALRALSREQPQQVQPQQAYHFSAGSDDSYSHANAAIPAQGPVNQTDQANSLSVSSPSNDGFTPAHQPSGLVNDNVAPNQPADSSTSTPDAVAQMQYNLLLGPVLEQPNVPTKSQASSSSQAVETPNFNSSLNSSLTEGSTMDFTYQSQEQPFQQQAFQVEPAQPAMGDDDLFGDGDIDLANIDLEQELADSLAPLAEFNTLN